LSKLPTVTVVPPEVVPLAPLVVAATPAVVVPATAPVVVLEPAPLVVLDATPVVVDEATPEVVPLVVGPVVPEVVDPAELEAAVAPEVPGVPEPEVAEVVPLDPPQAAKVRIVRVERERSTGNFLLKDEPIQTLRAQNRPRTLTDVLLQQVRIHPPQTVNATRSNLESRAAGGRSLADAIRRRTSAEQPTLRWIARAARPADRDEGLTSVGRRIAEGRGIVAGVGQRAASAAAGGTRASSSHTVETKPTPVGVGAEPGVAGDAGLTLLGEDRARARLNSAVDQQGRALAIHAGKARALGLDP
jgi:hypothetical protein